MASTRRHLTGHVEQATKARWVAYAKKKDVSLSVLLEAMGQLLPLEDDTKESPWLRRVGALASAIDDERRDRRPVD